MALGYSVVALSLDYSHISEEVRVCVCACVYSCVHLSPWVYVHRWQGWHSLGHFQTDIDTAFPIKCENSREQRTLACCLHLFASQKGCVCSASWNRYKLGCLTGLQKRLKNSNKIKQEIFSTAAFQTKKAVK